MKNLYYKYGYLFLPALLATVYIVSIAFSEFVDEHEILLDLVSGGIFLWSYMSFYMDWRKPY
jgi:hypothetical protein